MKRLTFLGLGLAIGSFPLPAFAGMLDGMSPVRAGSVDFNFGDPERQNSALTAADYLSGRVKRVGNRDVNEAVACVSGSTCVHMETNDPITNPVGSVAGMRWELGTAHMVPGGFGPLATGPLGKEPAGRKVLNLPGFDNEAEFKAVLVGIDEAAGTVTFRAYFRTCVRNPITKHWVTCTAYLAPGPLAWTLHEGDSFPVDITSGENPIQLPKSFKAQLKNLLKEAQNSGLIVPEAAPAPTTGSTPTGLPTTLPARSESTSANIVTAANNLRGLNTSNGPGGGRQACAYAVNRILEYSIGRKIGACTDCVLDVEAALRNGEGVQVSRAQTKAGAIIIAKHAEHIGICMNDGCTTVLSNSSTNKSISWVSDPTFGGSYDKFGGTEHFYQVK